MGDAPDHAVQEPAAPAPGPVRGEPANPLPPSTCTMWLFEGMGVAALLVVVAMAVAMAVDALMPWLPLLAAVAGIANAIVAPTLGYSRWRWELQAEELDLLRGVWRVERTIVPITRIQHVSVERTGWTDLFDLVRLHVHTAAGKTTIPGLTRPQADDLRDRILALLRTPDDL